MFAMTNLAVLIETISKKLGKDFVFTGKTLEGALNDNYLLEDKKSKYVLRIPKENLSQLHLIKEEYRGIGYVTEGSEYKFRNLREQFAFMEKCKQLGIPINEAIDFGENYMLLKFIEGITLEKFLNQTNNPVIINDYFSTVINAHFKGVVIGDRWGHNTIVTPQQDLVHIDFDIELTAEDAREFEVAQLIYFCILQSRNKEKATSLALDFANREELKFYDKSRIAEFLTGHCRCFTNSREYGGIETKIEQIVSQLRTISKSTSSATEKEKTMIFILKNKRYRIPLDSEVAKPDHYTQFLAEYIMPKLGGSALDIGTGSGVHAVIMVDFYKFNHVDGIDINQSAVELAKQTVASKGLEHAIKIFQGEFPEDFKLNHQYDLIISCPPQIPTPLEVPQEKNCFYFTNEGGYNGRQAVDKIIKNVFPCIKKRGHFQVLHADFIGVEQTCNLLRDSGLSPTITATRKARPGKLTTSRIDYIESLGYKFQKDCNGPYFDLVIITGEKNG